MADVSDFALAACTGISVLALSRPEEWNRLYHRVVMSGLLGFGIASVPASLIFASLHHDAFGQNFAWFWLTVGLAILGILTWGTFMQWLTKPRRKAPHDDAETCPTSEASEEAV